MRGPLREHRRGGRRPARPSLPARPIPGRVAEAPAQRPDACLPSSAVDVSVLVPVLNEGAWIRETAAAVCGQHFEGTIEFLFIDGRSEDDTGAVLAELAAQDPRIRVLDNPARHIPGALNIGLRHSRGTFVARMDAHSWYPADYVARGVERLGRGDADWVAGPAIPRATGVGPWARRVALALDSPLGQGGSRKWAEEATADADGNGAGTDEIELDTGVFAGIWRRETLEALGGWDEEWPVNEDAEMAGRVLAAGGRIVCLPALGAKYVARNSLDGLARQYWRFGYYRVKTVQRHPFALRSAHVVSAGLAQALLGAVLAPRRARSLCRAALATYALGIVGLSARGARTQQRRDVAALPAVFATMHLAWGLGFLWGCVRFGLPLAGMRHVLAHGLRAAPERVQADE